MKKLRIYLDTSVISHLDQQDMPEKMADTLEFWEIMKSRNDIEIIVSDLTMLEIEGCSEPKLSVLITKMDELCISLIEETPEHLELSRIYLSNGMNIKRKEQRRFKTYFYGCA